MLNHKRKFSLFVLLFILFGIYCFIFSESGLLERMRLESERKELMSGIQFLQRENKNLEELLNRHRQGEFIREEAQRAGYIKPGEDVLFVRGVSIPEEIADRQDSEVYGVKIEYLRIFWIVLSSLVVLMYMFVRKEVNTGE